LLAVTLATAVAVLGSAIPAGADGRATPGNFTGYGFDQCETVSQATMDTWLRTSPFLAVGVYMSGNSRACKRQTNLTAAWVDTQLRNGWRILPITLGPQSSCVGRFPRYGASIDPTIRESSTNGYAAARDQGTAEAKSAVAAATRLGIAPNSVLWYDIEGWGNVSDVSCRESALSFLQAWTKELHRLGYVSGVYSSAGSGMVVLDKARAQRPTYVLPDYLWIARWDGKANTSTSYISDVGWNPHRRVKQYEGGHRETWGGATVNIDRNFLDVGRGSVAGAETHCDGVVVDYLKYETLVPQAVLNPMVSVVQCLLKEQGFWAGGVRGWYGKTLSAAILSWQKARGFAPTTTWSQKHWKSLLSNGPSTIIKFGSAGPAVRRLQRALNAGGAAIPVTGVFDRTTESALRQWQAKVGTLVSGVAAQPTWSRLNQGQ
jgi:peptidoglycan hydrolase-like protein with peptidoglycan-binding domain